MRRPLLLLSCLVASALCLPAQSPGSAPAAADLSAVLPDSPLKARLRQLVDQKLPADQPAPKDPIALLRDELSFQPRRRWQLLPDLARQLAGDDDEQRQALEQLLTKGAEEARTALKANGADHDVGTAVALFLTQLWQFARSAELTAAQTEAVHAQLVSHLAVAEVGKMRAADKQRVWEYCVGYPVFVAAMLELVDTGEAKAQVRQLAALAFESLTGVAAADVEVGASGLARKGAAKDTPVAAGKGATKPATAAQVAGVVYVEPAGWSREQADGNLIFRATLRDVDDQGRPEANSQSTHQATIGLLPVLTATQGATALFEKTWKVQFAPFELGDTIVHFRSRLQSKLVVLYMGRFFDRPAAQRRENEPKTYGALYLVDLGGNRFQPLVALVEPRDPGLGMNMFKESAAMKALAFPLGAVLDSIRPAKGQPPYPAGGYFAAEDLRGRWSESSSAFGGHYYNSNTGGYAGAAVTASGGHFHLLEDGTYDYAFSYYAYNPQSGNQGGSAHHSGKYRLDGDIVLIEPEKPISYKFTCCAVGVGVRQTPQGPRRILVTVSARNDGQYLAPNLITNWDSYSGVMNWYCEDGK